jgi:hypothetical protein
MCDGSNLSHQQQQATNTIQVQRSNNHAMIPLLTKAFHTDPKQEFQFVTFALRKIATFTFLKAVLSQCH